MANPQIGSYSFIILDGLPEPMGEDVEIITRAGVDGIALSRAGLRSEPFTLKTMADFTSGSSAKTALKGYKALQGQLVTVRDGFGVTWNNIMVLRVRLDGPPAPCKTPVGGLNSNSTLTMSCEWECLVTETTNP